MELFLDSFFTASYVWIPSEISPCGDENQEVSSVWRR